MPRRELIKTSKYYYHVTTRSNHKHWFNLEMPRVWKICKIAMLKSCSECKVEIGQFVLMNNHYHMLVRTPELNLDKFMYFFNKTFSEKLRYETKEINRMFGSRYKASLIDNQDYLMMVFRYIYQNPLRAHLVKKCEDYPFSTLIHTINKKKWFVDYKEPFKIDEQFLRFINNEFSDSKLSQIKAGLNKTLFKPRLPLKQQITHS